MSDNDRPRDRYRERNSERDGPRERRGDRDRDRRPRSNERRNRSRSPGHERGGRRGQDYRSRSPHRRDERDNKSRGSGDRDRGRDDKGRDFQDRGRGRAPPTGPRGAPPPRHNDARTTNGGPARQPAPRTNDDVPDAEMKDSAQKPEDMDDDEWELQQIMGFAGFKTTKNTKIPGNDKNYGVRKDKKMEARQYMNRQGGFNRPLSPSRGA